VHTLEQVLILLFCSYDNHNINRKNYSDKVVVPTLVKFNRCVSRWTNCASKLPVFWEMPPCRRVYIYQGFRGACCLDLQKSQLLKIFVTIYRSTRRHILKDWAHHQYRSEYQIPHHQALSWVPIFTSPISVPCLISLTGSVNVYPA
jgi:hypothetical protein